MTASSPYTPAPAADFVLPFDLPRAGLRGRFVRLDGVSTRALESHKLPEAGARAAAEALVLAALFGSSLKLDGRLTVQTRSDGPVDLIAADYYGAEAGMPAGLRGYARLDEARLKPAHPDFAALVGKGALAITIEPRADMQSYQGVVALSPNGLAASAEEYFAQSEQLATAIRLAAAPLYEPGKPVRWRAGGFLLQATPNAPHTADDWDRLASHVKTIEDFELVDTALSAETLLWRLFHEDEARVLPAEPLGFRCNCDGERIAAVLKSYTAEDRAGLADADGTIRARCEFCGAVHELAPAAFAAAR